MHLLMVGPWTALASLILSGSVTLAAQDPASGTNPIVEMKTSLGKIRIELFPEKAPITVKNFLSYVDEKFYDGTLFHRVISSFMIQGGGFDDTDPMREKRMKPPINSQLGEAFARLIW